MNELDFKEKKALGKLVQQVSSFVIMWKEPQE